MNAATRDEMIARLAEAKQELDRLRCKQGGDPDLCPYVVKRVGRMIVVYHQDRPRGKWHPVYSISRHGSLWQMFLRLPERTTLAREVQKIERLVAEARERGEVEWTQRMRLDTLANKHVDTGWLTPSLWMLQHLTRLGIEVKFKRTRTAQGKAEQQEIRNLLKQLA